MHSYENSRPYLTFLMLREQEFPKLNGISISFRMSPNADASREYSLPVILSPKGEESKTRCFPRQRRGQHDNCVFDTWRIIRQRAPPNADTSKSSQIVAKKIRKNKVSIKFFEEEIMVDNRQAKA